MCQKWNEGANGIYPIICLFVPCFYRERQKTKIRISSLHFYFLSLSHIPFFSSHSCLIFHLLTHSSFDDPPQSPFLSFTAAPLRQWIVPGASPRIFEWGTNRRQVANLSPKYPKKSENTPDLDYFILESGRGRPLLNFSLEGTRPPPPPPPPPLSTSMIVPSLSQSSLLPLPLPSFYLPLIPPFSSLSRKFVPTFSHFSALSHSFLPFLLIHFIPLLILMCPPAFSGRGLLVDVC